MTNCFIGSSAFACILLSFALRAAAQTGAPGPGPGRALEGAVSQSGLDLQAVDKSVNPCADFYQYACGSWMKTHPIPADESEWGTFNLLYQRNQEILRGILEDAEKNENGSALDHERTGREPAAPNERPTSAAFGAGRESIARVYQQIGGFYQSCMAEPIIQQRGAAPLQPELDAIARIKDRKNFLDEVAHLQLLGLDVFFNFSSQPDPKDARMEMAGLDQGGLGLPEKDYYFRTDAKSQEIRKKYIAYIAQLFELTGVPASQAQAKAATVMAIETNLAKGSLGITERRNPQLLVHEMPESELSKLAPDFNFTAFFAQVKSPAFASVNVAVPDFLKAFNSLLASEGMPNLKDYLAWHYINASAPLLPKSFDQAHFDFYGKVLTGEQQQKPRWRRCVQATDDALGEALGRVYVEKTFGEQGKERTLAMVHQIEDEMGKDIESASWMTPETKKAALVKLHAVANKIGYPEKWRDYSSVRIVNDDYFGNSYRADEFEVRRDLNKIGKPVDRAEWEMTPPTVNAYYEPTENNINFPAGILQPPFYSNRADDAVNYGAVGVVVGHELTHGFDDQGRQFDANGNLKNWWQPSDAAKFKALADCFVKEYSGFSPVPGVHLNGRLTLGENTADNGGIRLAYMALLQQLSKKGVPPDQKVDGYTQSQQFFLGYAQVWCENVRPELARLRAQTDPHSPGRFRVNGVVRNMPQFDEVFGCKPGDAMYVVPGEGCRVW